MSSFNIDDDINSVGADLQYEGMNMLNINEEEEEDDAGRIQALEVAMNGVVTNQEKTSQDMRTMMQQIAEMSNLMRNSQAQSGLGSLQHQGPASDTGSVSSMMSNAEGAPGNLYDTGKICLVNSSADYGWYVVYKKREHLRTMYTYRGNDLKTLSSAQIRSLKDHEEQTTPLGRA
jgi:hypothetical protein